MILSGVHWTLQMCASNLLIPFMSVCWLRVQTCPRVHEGVFVKDRWRLCVGNESISFTLVWLPSRGGRLGAASCIGCLFASSLLSHMLLPFCLYCSLSHLSHSLPATVFASEPSSSTARLYLPVMAWPYLAALNIFIFHCSVYFYLLSTQSPSVSPLLHLFTIDPSGLFTMWLSKIILKKVTEIDARLWWRIFQLGFGVMTQNCCYFRAAKT